MADTRPLNATLDHPHLSTIVRTQLIVSADAVRSSFGRAARHSKQDPMTQAEFTYDPPYSSRGSEASRARHESTIRTSKGASFGR